MRTRGLILGLMIASGGATGGMASGQAPQPAAAPPAADAPAEQAHPLGGPKVVSQEAPRTLVKNDLAGKLIETERRPEAEAIDLLELSEREKADVQRVLAEREAEVSRVLYDNLEVFLGLQGTLRGGNPRESLAAVMQAREVAASLLEPSLASRLGEVLSEPNRAEFTRLLGEYEAALARSLPERGPAGRGTPRDAAVGAEFTRRRVETHLLLKEIGRSLASNAAEKQGQMDAFLKAINATAEQESKIRAIAQDAASGNPLKEPDARARAERFRRIFALLTPQQRAAAREYYRAR
ncbi:MAG: hypothetical protein SFY69_03175 [Planctomycetota bacterium]|nr:hypothetical protein [Planctomycetota bacterium]